jgi:hypothetical protein
MWRGGLISKENLGRKYFMSRKKYSEENILCLEKIFWGKYFCEELDSLQKKLLLENILCQEKNILMKIFFCEEPDSLQTKFLAENILCEEADSF